ncbi:hypothetical protein H671_1g1060 [Cricetulus griseus]|uniref:Uncharacterized protein n=1 Tax=Cricetulus griseus TaxID=10029 RepID=A0A061IRG5_CRIGR|nr:hypothetical protein H671_1g1060 [Cricetulus griseus]
MEEGDVSDSSVQSGVTAGHNTTETNTNSELNPKPLVFRLLEVNNELGSEEVEEGEEKEIQEEDNEYEVFTESTTHSKTHKSQEASTSSKSCKDSESLQSQKASEFPQSSKTSDLPQSSKTSDPPQSSKTSDPSQSRKASDPPQSRKASDSLQSRKASDPIQPRKAVDSRPSRKGSEPLQARKGSPLQLLRVHGLGKGDLLPNAMVTTAPSLIAKYLPRLQLTSPSELANNGPLLLDAHGHTPRMLSSARLLHGRGVPKLCQCISEKGKVNVPEVTKPLPCAPEDQGVVHSDLHSAFRKPHNLLPVTL